MPNANDSEHRLQPSAKKQHNYETENFWLDKYKYQEAEEYYAAGNGFFQRLLASGGDSTVTMDQFMKRFDQLERDQKAMQQQLNQMSRGILDQLAAIQQQLGGKAAEQPQSTPAVSKRDQPTGSVSAPTDKQQSASSISASTESEQQSSGILTQLINSAKNSVNGVATLGHQLVDQISAATTPSNATTPASTLNATPEPDAVESSSAANGAKKKRRKKPAKGGAPSGGAAGDTAEVKSEAKSDGQQQQMQKPQQSPQQPQKDQQANQQNSQQQQKAQKSQKQQKQQQQPKPQQQQPASPAAGKPNTKDEDEIDLFGSDQEEESEDAKRVREERLKQYAEKKSTKPALIAKSNVILDVKPWDDETDMKLLEESVRSVKMDGLLWGQSKLVPLAYGIKKLQISCVVEDEKVSIEELTEKLQEFEDFVQSVDIAAFNKI